MPVAPPTSFAQTVKRLGPGMIVAGSIVGSGELIATTKVGAEAGFALLWLIILGCVIKVFAQVEFGRHSITHGETPLRALNSVPGPRWKCNWLVWYWALMTCLIISQQGGIVGGVGQALSISAPLTQAGREYNRAVGELGDARVALAIARSTNETSRDLELLEQRIHSLQQGVPAEPTDPYIWACVVAIATSILLYFGRYRLIQSLSTIMVVGFTAMTMLTVLLLQTKEFWAIRESEIAEGMRFQIPPANSLLSRTPLATALAAFGIIGVGASELIMYPYWCLEKGYAKFTGPREDTLSWASRASGWMRVMHIDVWFAMVVYTFATVAFYLLGAAVLGRVGLNPSGGEMVRALSEMYVPVFGSWAPSVFLIGAVAVLYSTFFVAAAGHSRMVADGLGLFGWHDGTDDTRSRWSRVLGTIWPLVAVILFCWIRAPALMVLASGVAQAIMLPMLGWSALYFRYWRCDTRLRPSMLWDLCLWISVTGLFVAGVWSAISNLGPLFSAR